MAKPTGGLLAFSARGTVAKTITFASWRGRQYVRQHVIPANPRSTSQTSTRNVFKWLSASWKSMPAVLQAAWTLAASGTPTTDRNLWVKANLANLRSATTLALLNMMSGAKGGAPITGNTVSSPGAGAINVGTVIAPLPTGWAVSNVIAAAIKDADPHSPYTGSWFSGTTATLAGTINLTGLPTGTYRVSSIVEYTKADGSFAYSPAFQKSQAVA